MALRVPLERAKPGRERGRREEEALGFIPPCAFMLGPPSFRSIGHALPPSLLLHTPNKHSSTHVRARNQNSVPPAVKGAQGLSVHLGRACRHQGRRSTLSNLKRLQPPQQQLLAVGEEARCLPPWEIFIHKHANEASY